MILVLCNDDPDVLAHANTDATTNPGIFGAVHLFIQAATPELGVNENLFITAHGIQGEIGNHAGPLAFNAQKLLDYLTNHVPNNRGASLFPQGYVGDIYISVCYGGNVQRGLRLSFIEQFHSLARVVLPHSSVYGQVGSVAMAIPLPGRGWTQVANL